MREIKKEERPEVDLKPKPLAIEAAAVSDISTMEFVPGEAAETLEPRTTSVYTSMTRKKDESPKTSHAGVRITDQEEEAKGRDVSRRFTLAHVRSHTHTHAHTKHRTHTHTHSSWTQSVSRT